MRSPLSRFLRFCCLAALTLVLCLVHGTWLGRARLSAQASDPAFLVSQGVAAYRDYRYAEAIEQWKQALEHYPAKDASPERALILENLARAYRQQGQFTPALDHWREATTIYTSQANWLKVAQTLTAQAQDHNRLGQPIQALGLLCGNAVEPSRVAAAAEANLPSCTSESAVAIAQRSGNAEAQVAALGSLGEIYRSVQAYEAALPVLQWGLTIASNLEKPYSKALLQNSLGNTYREQAELNYQRATASIRSASGDEGKFLAWASQAQADALRYLTESYTTAQREGYLSLETKALLGLIAVQSYTNEPTATNALYQQAVARLKALPPTQETAYFALKLVKKRQPLMDSEGNALAVDIYRSSRSQCLDLHLEPETRDLLEQALSIAKKLEHNRLKSFTEGELGHFYECNGDDMAALEWTQKARLSASSDRILALDTLYLWQWQTGRIYRHRSELEKAIAFYIRATDNLNRIRDEILATNQTLQFEFRDAIAPVYRELAELQLASVPAVSEPETAAVELQKQPDTIAVKSVPSGLGNTDTANRSSIRSALGNIDNLQLAELQNYFGSDCIVPVAEHRLDEILGQAISDPTQTTQLSEASAALISTIVLPDKTAVILTLPGQAPKLHWISWQEAQLRKTIIEFRNGLEDVANDLDGYDTQLAQSLYAELIAPFKSALEASYISTLVFVHDGILRNIPMAALYDGISEKYLAQQYAVAVAPSLQQTTVGSTDRTGLKALILGLSQNPIVDGQELGALPAVEQEVQDVIGFLPESELLLDEELTQSNLQQKLQVASYPVVHIATHGKFGTDPKDTFLVLGDKEPALEATPSKRPENKRLSLGELDTLIRQGEGHDALLELIALSACQTASGDERSTLGLAGVTIRAGAESALASLWTVTDDATADLMKAFYSYWTNGMSKAQALQKAQLQVMADSRYKHPGYWSAFVLVGEWG